MYSREYNQNHQYQPPNQSTNNYQSDENINDFQFNNSYSQSKTKSQSSIPLLNLSENSSRSLPSLPVYTSNQQDSNQYEYYPHNNDTKQEFIKNHYEMNNLNRVLPSLPPQQQDENYRNPFIDEPINSSSPSQPTNPFKDNELEKRLRKNEKNRLHTLKSKPRFHFTKLPYFTIIVTLIQIIIFIIELVKMSILTGSAFQTQPYFNPMLGPSNFLLINMGSRYVACMRQIKGLTDDTSILFPCANSTSIDTYQCSLNELCGLSGMSTFDNNTKYNPNQWYRIFIPIFLHAGFLHIIFNLLLQLTMGASIERNIGILKYSIIYILSGISGFLLGANFTPAGIASTGASGSLFGIVATNILLFIYTGRKNANMYGTKHYSLFIFFMIIEIVVSLVLGLLPGLDNFSHIGGFAMGILSGILLLKDPFWVYQDGIITYKRNQTTWQLFLNNWNPMYAYEDKVQIKFFIWCSIRVISLVLMIVYFVLLAKNFFNNETDSNNSCEWCKYFNCIPVKGWCDIGEISVTTSESTPTATATPSSITVPTEIYSTATYTTTAANNNGGFIKRELPTPAKTTITESDFGVGIGLYLILTIFMISFMKKRKII
ncbi:uncharacterized protein KGF55_004085 [Candida pseudojiufengensis]|uniref:uncharacterized protein n=1 Tax=Candida pseudojiufengensis TaxID=497109 RepID=UPI002225777E|nr:uncharacterized protein KGF55_004085 [Candida pseudojiufengensis]KAI5961462.1 hypothetical protein KGF55_004085 [Candida pseudojiufengensis]